MSQLNSDLTILNNLVNDNAVDLSDFYAVSLHSGVRFQGHFSSTKSKRYSSLPGFKSEVQDNGFIRISNEDDNVAFILT